MKAYATIYPLKQPKAVESALAKDEQAGFNSLLDWLCETHHCIGTDGNEDSGMFLFHSIDERDEFNHDLANACRERNLPFLFKSVPEPVSYRIKEKKEAKD